MLVATAALAAPPACDDACVADLAATAAAEAAWGASRWWRGELDRALAARGIPGEAPRPDRWGWKLEHVGDAVELSLAYPPGRVLGGVLVRTDRHADVRPIGAPVCTGGVDDDRVALVLGDGCDRVEVHAAADWSLLDAAPLPFAAARVQVVGSDWLAVAADGRLLWRHPAGVWTTEAQPDARLGTFPHERGGLLLAGPIGQPGTVRFPDGRTRDEVWAPCPELSPLSERRMRCRLGDPEAMGSPDDTDTEPPIRMAPRWGVPATDGVRKVTLEGPPGAVFHLVGSGDQRVVWLGRDGRAVVEDLPAAAYGVRAGPDPAGSVPAGRFDATVRLPPGEAGEVLPVLTAEAPALRGGAWFDRTGAASVADGVVSGVRAGPVALETRGPTRRCATVVLGAAPVPEVPGPCATPTRRIRVVDLAGEPIGVETVLGHHRIAIGPEGLEVASTEDLRVPDGAVAEVVDGVEVWRLPVPPRVAALRTTPLAGRWVVDGRPQELVFGPPRETFRDDYVIAAEWPGGVDLRSPGGVVRAVQTAPDRLLLDGSAMSPATWLSRAGATTEPPTSLPEALGAAAGAAWREGPGGWLRARAVLEPRLVAEAGWSPTPERTRRPVAAATWAPVAPGGPAEGRWRGRSLEVEVTASAMTVGAASGPIRLTAPGLAVSPVGIVRTVGPDLALWLGPETAAWLWRLP